MSPSFTLFDSRTGAAVEQRLAASRAVLALVSLLAVYLDPTEPTRFVRLAYVLLATYSIHSLLVVALLWRRPGLATRLGWPLHAIDVVWAAILTVISQGPSSPFFPLFVFVLLAAAYRWGFRATIVTAAWTIGLLLLEAALISSPGQRLLQPVELNRLIIRCAYVLLVAYLVGYLAETEKQLRAEASAIAGMTALARVEPGLTVSMQAVFDRLMHLAGACEAAFVFHEGATARSYLWTASSGGTAPANPFRWRELTAEEGGRFLVGLPAGICAADAGRDASGTLKGIAINPTGDEMAFDGVTADALGRMFPEWDCLMFFAVTVGDDSTARLLLRHADVTAGSVRRLASLDRIVRQVFPALHNLYLLRRLRTRAGAIERARVARELHDGIIQSLLGLEMQLDVVRRQTGDLPQTVATRLEAIQRLLHDEVLNVRDLMQQMRPIDTDARNLLDTLAELVERFRREAGIEARFVSEFEEVGLPPRTCREIARIVQEALVNVRKHSSASNVVVRFGAKENAWLLSVDDDGRGFEFEGRLSHEQLESRRKGPIVIKERVRTIGGTLAIESAPGRGTRLEIAVPRTSRYA